MCVCNYLNKNYYAYTKYNKVHYEKNNIFIFPERIILLIEKIF